MKKLLATVVALLLLALVTSTGFAQATVTNEHGLGIIFSVGNDREHYDALFVLDQISPDDCCAFWRHGNDLAAGRIKRAASVSLHGRITVIGADEPGRFMFAWKTTGALNEAKYDVAQNYSDFTISAEYFGAPGTVTPLEVHWRDRRGKHDYVRVIFKITWPRTASVTSINGMFIDNIADPCQSGQRTAKNLAQWYRYYQNTDPTFGGGVVDPKLLAEAARDQKAASDHQQKEFTDSINAAQAAQDGRIDNVEKGIKDECDARQKDVTALGQTLASAMKDDRARISNAEARLDRLEKDWQEASQKQPAQAQVYVSGQLMPATTAASTLPRMIRFQVAFERDHSMRVASSLSGLQLTAVEVECTSGIGSFPTGVADYLRNGLLEGTTVSFRYRRPGCGWQTATFTVTSDKDGKVVVIPVL